MFTQLARSGVLFIRHIVGIVVCPYETYRDIEKRGSIGEIFYIAVVVGAYFFVSSVVKISSFHPLLLSRYAAVLFIAALSGYFLIIAVLHGAGRLVGTTSALKRIYLLWAYTLIPTVVWFTFTSILYVLFPPPRTTQISGIMLSVVYLIVSAMIFWWKLTLSYLTLRFGLKLDFGKIVIVVLVLLPVVSVWTYLMYVLNVYKVPFL